MDQTELDTVFVCPRCHAPVGDLAKGPCEKAGCPRPFPVVGGQPALVDFETAVIDRDRFLASAAASVVQNREVSLPRRIVRRLIGGSNPVAAQNGVNFVKALKALSPRPRVLIVGGGVRGAGVEAILADKDIQLRAFDVYVSEHTDFVADGHAIPVADDAFDGVWVQAVLEHVVEPHKVTAEIHRVLKPGGILYAETPFLQGVHEGAYDFTRFTHSGHRYLFQRFEEIASGAVQGPGTSLLWAVRLYWRALLGSEKLANLLTLPFAWLPFTDRFIKPSAALDAGNGFFFLGRKREAGMTHREIVAYYAGAGPR